ncbi:MAG: threonylcarbamoyl-AMP synthase [Deltaproteobacteria bacterium]|nr:threonylcarbamoyl-AMP synthase [Deltaproteobacteria bacterium]MBW2069044.1 threonylcarbamoyl-AMP synthase [Deltaproteobacteria bacterium]
MKPNRVVVPSDPGVLEQNREKWRKLLDQGAIFVFPTETLYGIGTSAKHDKGVLKIFELKGRKPDHPLPLIAANPGAAFSMWKNPPDWLANLARSFWPGPVTFVFRASENVSRYVTGGRGTVGIRVSPQPIARLLAELASGAIIATSANVSGGEPVLEPEELSESFRKGVDVIIDVGPLSSKTPSTVVDCTIYPPKLIREGVVPFSEILKALT